MFLTSDTLGRSSGSESQQLISIDHRRSACSIPVGICVFDLLGFVPPTTLNTIAESFAPAYGISRDITS